jgi:hypothetical protein
MLSDVIFISIRVVRFRSGVRSTTIPPTTLSFNIPASVGGTVAVKRWRRRRQIVTLGAP